MNITDYNIKLPVGINIAISIKGKIIYPNIWFLGGVDIWRNFNITYYPDKLIPDPDG